jgi:hypothetical protein
LNTPAVLDEAAAAGVLVNAPPSVLFLLLLLLLLLPSIKPPSLPLGVPGSEDSGQLLLRSARNLLFSTLKLSLAAAVPGTTPSPASQLGSRGAAAAAAVLLLVE